MASGMYGEMPEVKIGKITVSKMSENKDDDRLWMLHEDGEGMEVNGPTLEKLQNIMEAFFNHNF